MDDAELRKQLTKVGARRPRAVAARGDASAELGSLVREPAARVAQRSRPAVYAFSRARRVR